MKRPSIPHARLYISLCVSAVILLLVVIGINTHDDTSLAMTAKNTTGAINLLAGQWDYMPGVSVTAGGLAVAYRGFKIVEQDGSGGQPNPSVNMYGTRVNVSGNFILQTTLTHIHGGASLQLYGKLPEISDEFRVEEPSIRLTVNGDQLTAAVWNGQATQDLANQQPSEQQTFPISPGSTVAISIASSNGQLALRANGKALGTITANTIFGSGAIWIGANAEDVGGSFTIAALDVAPLSGGSVAAVNTATATVYTKKQPTGLQTLADIVRPGFLIGSDVALWAIANHAYGQAIFGGNFGIVTPENAMKWQFIEPQPGIYDFHEADALVNLATKNNMQVHGHALVFSEALPAWVRNLPTQTPAQKAYVQQVMIDHIKQTVSHFKGRVSEWDVVNEPIADYDDNGNLTQTFRDNVFYQAMGEQYIQIALEAAHSADPTAKLYINDYGDENDTGARWQATYDMLKSLKDSGTPLYGFGFESHIYDPAADDIANAADDNGHPILDDNINALAAIGLKSRISEMDAPADDPGYASDNSSQTAQFTGVLSICLHNPNCTTFGMWSMGITDLSQDTGQQHYSLVNDAVDSPFDQRMQPTPVYTALQKLLGSK